MNGTLRFTQEKSTVRQKMTELFLADHGNQRLIGIDSLRHSQHRRCSTSLRSPFKLLLYSLYPSSHVIFHLALAHKFITHTSSHACTRTQVTGTERKMTGRDDGCAGTKLSPALNVAPFLLHHVPHTRQPLD